MDDYFSLLIYRASSWQDTELQKNISTNRNNSTSYVLPEFPGKAVIGNVRTKKDGNTAGLCAHTCA